MPTLDLRTMHCPLALVTLKRTLLSADGAVNSSLKVLFSSTAAMQDILLYLDKKKYQYRVSCSEPLYSLVISIIPNKGFKHD